MRWTHQSLYLGLLLVDLSLAASCDKDVKISAQSDVEGYSSCRTISGDVTIDKHFSGDLNLKKIEKITGSLTCEGAKSVSSLSAPDLKSIGSKFKLSELTTLTKLDFPSLSGVGSVDWDSLPLLQALSLKEGISSVDSISVARTGLSNLNGIDLKSASNVTVVENEMLSHLDFSKLGNYTTLQIAGNQGKLSVDLSGVTTAGYTEIHNASKIDLSSLESLTSNLTLKGVSFSKLKLPELTKAGPISIQNTENSKLDFPKLKTVHGDLDLQGKFKDIDIPDLEGVQGSFIVKSSESIDCDQFSEVKVSGPTFSCSSDGKDNKYSTNTSYVVPNPVSTFAPASYRSSGGRGSSGRGGGGGARNEENSAAGLRVGLSGVALVVAAVAVSL